MSTTDSSACQAPTTGIRRARRHHIPGIRNLHQLPRGNLGQMREPCLPSPGGNLGVVAWRVRNGRTRTERVCRSWAQISVNLGDCDVLVYEETFTSTVRRLRPARL